MDTTAFDIWFDEYMSKPTQKGTTQVKLTPGPSIIEAIEEEWHSCPDSQYSDGIAECLLILDRDQDGTDRCKPYFALQDELKFAREHFDSEYARGVETALFIFTNLYQWLNGERPQCVF